MRRIETPPSAPCHRTAALPVSLGLALALATVAWAAGCVAPAATGTIRGTVRSVSEQSSTHPPPLAILATPLGDTARATAAAEPATVTLREGFTPHHLAMTAGQQLRFVNRGSIYHHLFCTLGETVEDLGEIRTGEERRVTLHEQGTVRFYCSLHEGESLLAFVTGTPHCAAIGPAGDFELPDLPAGRYAVQTWDAEGVLEDRQVRVEPGMPTTVDVLLSERENGK